MKSEVKFLSTPKTGSPILIEGLPGIGYVGKLAAEHLVAEFSAEKFAELYSPHFPHHVVVERDGSSRLLRNGFYFARTDRKEFIIVTGDAQATSPEGHYEVVNLILDVAEKFGVKRLFTLGGYATGEYPTAKPKVVATASDPEFVHECEVPGVLKGVGVGSIMGASGLMLALGRLRGMRGACLLGETHGALIDPRSTQAVLEVLGRILGIDIDTTALEQRAREVEALLGRLRREFKRREHLERRREEEEAWYIA